jgi:hypothetical protein
MHQRLSRLIVLVFLLFAQAYAQVPSLKKIVLERIPEMYKNRELLSARIKELPVALHEPLKRELLSRFILFPFELVMILEKGFEEYEIGPLKITPKGFLDSISGKFTEFAWARRVDLPSGLSYRATFRDEVELYDKQNKYIRTVASHRDYIGSIELSPDGLFLLSASHDHAAVVWDTAKSSRNLAGFLTFKCDLVHPYMVSSARYSSNGLYVVTTCFGKKVRVWDWQAGTCIECLEGPDYHDFNFAAFSCDGFYIVAQRASSGTVVVWQNSGLSKSFEDVLARCAQIDVVENLIARLRRWIF